jgi:hypothetical protein
LKIADYQPVSVEGNNFKLFSNNVEQFQTTTYLLWGNYIVAAGAGRCAGIHVRGSRTALAGIFFLTNLNF